nr:heat shock factor protein HSF8-like [Ipomoea batatas]
MMMPEISQLRDIVPESNMDDILGSEASSGNLIDPTSLVGNGNMPIYILRNSAYEKLDYFLVVALSWRNNSGFSSGSLHHEKRRVVKPTSEDNHRAPLKSNTFRGIYLAVNIFDNEDNAELESGSKNCKDRRCSFDEVYSKMWSSNLWIARRRDLLEGSGFCPEEIMIVKFCSTDLERITSRKISCTRNPLILPTSSLSANFVDSGLDPSQLKSKPSPSSQVLNTSVYALDLREESSSDPATTSKAELELVKNIFSVINQFPDYLHPCFNLWIDFFLLVRNSQNRRETMESIHHLFRIISNPSQERVLFTDQH